MSVPSANPYPLTPGLQLALHSSENTILEEESRLFGIQVPFLIGMSSKLNFCFIKKIISALGYAPAVDFNMVNEVALQTLGFSIQTWRKQALSHPEGLLRKLLRMTTSDTRRTFAKGIHQRHNPFQPVTSRVSKVEVKRCFFSQDTVTEEDVQQLTISFLDALQYYVFAARLIKGILLHDLSSQVKLIYAHVLSGDHYPRAGSRCVLGNLNQRVQRLVNEVFLLRYIFSLLIFLYDNTRLCLLFSFNGSRYDCPALLPFVYKYTLRPEARQRRCRIKVFRRGTVVNSGKSYV